MRACLRDVRFDDWASGSCSPASPGEARLSSIGSGLLPPGLRLEWGRCRFARTARSSSSMSSATTQASAQRRSRGWSGLARVPRSSKAMSSSRLRDLLDEFSTLDPRGSDAGEIDCAGGYFGCPAEGRRLSSLADCSGVRPGRVVMRATLRRRFEEARRSCFPSTGWRIAGKFKQSLFGSRVSQRIARRRERLIDVGHEAR